jgi:hypothetical protein
MPLYSNCTIRIVLPRDYSKKDELTKALQSEFVGCEMNFEESATVAPYVEDATVAESTQAGGLHASEWAPFGGTAPMENMSGEYLARSASEAIHKFLDEST